MSSPTVRQGGRVSPRPGFLPSDSSKPTAPSRTWFQTGTARPPLTRSVCLSNFFIAFLQPSFLRSLTACSGTSRQRRAAGQDGGAGPGVQIWLLLLLLPMAGHLPPLPTLCPGPCPPLLLTCRHARNSLRVVNAPPPAHLGTDMLVPAGAILPVSVLDCELRAGAGRDCVCLSAVSFWCPVTIPWITVGTDESRLPSPAHSSPMAPWHLEPQSSSPSAWHPRPLPASRSPSLKEAPVLRTISSAQSTLSSAALHLTPG